MKKLKQYTEFLEESKVYMDSYTISTLANNVGTGPAEEFLNKHVRNPDLTSNFENIMIKFAQYHVERALKEASEKAEMSYFGLIENSDCISINKNSILSADPTENIK